MTQWAVEIDSWFGCHIWRGAVNNGGYPTVWEDGRPRQAYYVALERAGIDVPPGREPDHLCRRRLCVAVAHLELVTRVVNQQRKSWATRSQMASCPRGHDLFVHGRTTPEKGTVCRICSGVWSPKTRQAPDVR